MPFIMRQMRISNIVSGLMLSVFLCAALGANQAMAADAKAGKAKAGVCAGCHGVTGQSQQPIWPHIAGQGSKYIAKQLHAFRDQSRAGAQMAAIVANLTDDDISNLAAYFSSLPAAQGTADEAVASVGEKLYRAGDTNKNIPACMSCHGPGGRGMDAAAFPATAGQHAQYAVTQLKNFAAKKRTGVMMQQIAGRLDDAQMEAVAQYMAGLR